ncbi:MAG TPA: DUF3800 domain-containing protein [Acidobacteriaceae bacterium]|nr:DUF3800 domain-containing protein [Acidobacteriaceae bacterium]
MFDLEAYWDDSGTHAGSPVAIASCYIANALQWREFVRNWDEARSEEGFDVFHMADFMARPEHGVKPYCEWSREKKRHVFFRLASIIKTRIRQGYAFGVPVDAYERCAPDRFKSEVAPDGFTFAVSTILSMISEWYARFGDGKGVRYIFENRCGSGKIGQQWELMKERPDVVSNFGARPMHPDGLLFRDKRYFKPLQAADILAWNAYHYFAPQVVAPLESIPPTPKPYIDALWTPSVRLSFMNEAQLKEGFAAMKEYEEREGKRSYWLPSQLVKGLRKHNPSDLGFQ